MPGWTRRVSAFLIAIPIMFFMALAEVPAASAQAEMKRSAGTMSRGMGERKSNQLGSQTRGRSSGISSSRNSTRPSSRSFDDDDDDDWRKHPIDDDVEEKDEKNDKEEIENEEETESEKVDYGSRTLGRACMYGARGEVIFRPKGSRCRGDAPAAPVVSDSVRSDRKRRAAMRRDTQAEGLTPSTSRRSEAAPNKRRAQGSCIYGGDGRVVYAPAGATCRR